MANLYVNLPLPAMNGPGAAVATSGMGIPKTIVVDGEFPGATITVEASTDGGTEYAPVPNGVFTTGSRELTVGIVATHMRVNVKNRKTSLPFSANIDVGATDAGAQFVSIPMPAGNGPGASVDVSALGYEWTFVAGGSFPGATITLEVSEDNVGFAPIAQFSGQGGIKTAVVTGDHVRVNVLGRRSTVPFSGTMSGGAADPFTSSGGIAVQDAGVAIGPPPFTTLNFTGSGVTATDAGGGVAQIDIPGAPPSTVDWQEEGVAVLTSGTANFVGAGATVTNVAGVATITIPGGISGVAWQEEGGAVVSSATANFVGAGATVTNVAGVATITIPGGLTRVEDEGVSIGGPFQALNFAGAGVTATDAGGGEALVTIPGGLTRVEDEGVSIGGPFIALNFAGAGVTATDAGSGEATITIPGGITGIAVEDDGVPVAGSFTTLNFVNALVVDAGGGEATVTVPIGTGFFGDGSDGTATMDGAAVVAGITPAASVYTAARDYFFDALTINTAIDFKTVGYRVFCKTSLTLTGTARIHFNGNNGGNAAGAVGGTAGAAVAAGVLAGSQVAGAGAGSGAGGGSAPVSVCPRGYTAGSASTGTGGAAGTIGNAGGTGASGQGGGGGGGGGAVAGTGGSGGGPGGVTLAAASAGDIRVFVNAMQGRTSTASAFSTGSAGSGGGAGGNAGSNLQGGGGGGGASGGYVLVSARVINGTGTIEARGGNAGNGAAASGANHGGGGGGGGGSGGIAVVYTGSPFSSAQINVAGGTGGTGGAGGAGAGAGAVGGAGGSGIFINETL